MEEQAIPEFSTLLEQVVERDNMVRAYRRVKQNRGTAGLDGMTVDELHGYLHCNWPKIKEQLLSGKYIPKPVRRVEIPQTGRRHKVIRCADGSGSFAATGDPPDIKSVVRAFVFHA